MPSSSFSFFFHSFISLKECLGACIDNSSRDVITLSITSLWANWIWEIELGRLEQGHVAAYTRMSIGGIVFPSANISPYTTPLRSLSCGAFQISIHFFIFFYGITLLDQLKAKKIYIPVKYSLFMLVVQQNISQNMNTKSLCSMCKSNVLPPIK